MVGVTWNEISNETIIVLPDLQSQRCEQLKQIKNSVQQKMKKLEKLAHESEDLTCGWKNVSQPPNTHAYLLCDYHFSTNLGCLLWVCVVLHQVSQECKEGLKLVTYNRTRQVRLFQPFSDWIIKFVMPVLKDSWSLRRWILDSSEGIMMGIWYR